MENPNEKPFTQMGWKVGCPATANAMLWITTKIRGKNSSLLVKGDWFCFIPMERGVATIKREEVIAFIPLMAPSPYVQLSEKSCPFCGGVGEITEDDIDTVTCFKCDYTVNKSVWEKRL